MDLHTVIKHPVSTERSLRLMQEENKLIFVVDEKANKQLVKQAVEKVFNTKVSRVNTLRTSKGEKRAYVQFAQGVSALDIATNLGLM